MLNQIFDIIGTPSVQQLGCMDQDAKDYIHAFKRRAGSGLKAIFPNLDDSTFHIMAQLKFSPSDRISAHKALEHPLFRDVRNKSEEKTAPEAVDLDFLEELNEDGLTESHLREQFFQEISRYSVVIEKRSG